MQTGERAFHYRANGDPLRNGVGLITSSTPPTASFRLENSELDPFKVDIRDLMTEAEAEERDLY